MSLGPDAQRDLACALNAGRITWEEYEAALASPAKVEPASDAPRFKGPKKLICEPPKGVPPWLYSRRSAVADRDKRLCRGADAVLGTLLTWARGRGVCEAFVEQIADTCGISPRWCQKMLQRLEECGYIRIARRRSGRLNDASLYYLTAQAIAPASSPRRRGGERSDTPRTVATQPECSLSRSSTRSKRGGAERRTPPRAPSALAPPRSVRGGDGSAGGKAQKPGQDGAEWCPGTIDLEDWLREHPPPE